MKILRPEVNECLNQVSGIYDMFDNTVKVLFNITDEEYDFILENASESDIEIFITSLGDLGKSSTFSERRAALIVRNSLLSKFKTNQ